MLYGDVPLIKKETLEELMTSADKELSILTTILEDPYGYGRVKKDDSGNALAIVEEKDASDDEKNIKEIFTGVLCGQKELLAEGLAELNNNNACLLYTSPSPRDATLSRMPSSA